MTGMLNDETAITRFLADPKNYPSLPDRVDVIETHVARVYLAGKEALKVRKHIRLPFLDFSTLGARGQAAQRELALNQPFAPSIYLGLVAITRRRDGRLQFAGEGEPIDWAVRMRRFPQDALLERVADAGPLSQSLSRSLAAMVAEYHRVSPVAKDNDGSGRVARLVTKLSAELSSAQETVLQVRDIVEFGDRGGICLDRITELLNTRAANGTVRRCHGDMHLANIVLLDGRPIPFDALEFDEELATIDVLYDLAFLLMDLHTRGDTRAANIVLNAYLHESPIGGEIDGLACLPLFLACRAVVRSIVALTRAGQKECNSSSQAHEDSARRHFGWAKAYLEPKQPVLLAVGGLSGTGKSTVASMVAPDIGLAPGAIHLRSDVERKRLFGVRDTDRLDPHAYRLEVTAEIYRRLNAKAQAILRAGHSVIIDAVFLTPPERAAAARAAAVAGGHFVGLWLEAPEATLLDRIARRREDASDADASVVRSQLASDIGPISWHRIDAGQTPEQSLTTAHEILSLAGLC